MNRINLTESELAEQVARIQNKYDYDATQGLLVNRRTGKAVKGSRHGRTQYKCLGFKFHHRTKHMLYHSAVWAWHHGRLPKEQIDHIDGNERNNRIENLREVSYSENQMNTLHNWSLNPVTGLPGVNFNNGSYRTRIHGKVFRFHDKYEAFAFKILLGQMFQ